MHIVFLRKYELNLSLKICQILVNKIFLKSILNKFISKTSKQYSTFTFQWHNKQWNIVFSLLGRHIQMDS